MKRFTETEKWHDAWFRKLEPKQKLLFLYILDNCDAAGIISIDVDLWSFQIGQKFDSDFSFLNERAIFFQHGTEKFIGVKNFIKFQYGKLKKEYNPHFKVWASLEKYFYHFRLNELNLLELSSLDQALPQACPKLMDKNKDKNMDKTKSMDKCLSPNSLNLSDLDKALAGFEEMRKKIRKPLTDHAKELVLRELEKLAPGDEKKKIELLNQSTMNSWQGVFPLSQKRDVKTISERAEENHKKATALYEQRKKDGKLGSSLFGS